jgi:chloramphenicol-sensitive protein RarD
VLEQADNKNGYGALIIALSWWGAMPLYYWFLKNVSPIEMLAHRIVWSFIFLSLFLCLFRRPIFRSLSIADFRISLFPAAMLSINWVVYIYASITGNALQASLGYFLNPLLSVALGVLFFKERLNGLKLLAVMLGLVGTIIQCTLQGELPVYALLLTVTFSLLGLSRKIWPTKDAIVTTWMETVVMLPVAITAINFILMSKQIAFFSGTTTTILLILAGPLTIVPLGLYAFGIPKVKLTESAILQYLTPTVTFLLAIFYFGEKLNLTKLSGFVVIWLGLFMYTMNLLKSKKQAVTGIGSHAGRSAS